ncbi:hypothetical protein K435DRAFT_974338 [Dendrothele bispora CBS 962.96]|uniref:Uncharacterized protein n=1 Tax=Dendrothele bispora (strain CBS 962.96) TaxID=1314807 RepID=A0A4S8KM59_DENBC|nr:hypothetical protein K435DRAFT_974338 [Dendrothele bispora CBS 962.96]
MNIDTPSFSLTFSPSPTPSRFTPFDAKQSSPRARWKRLVKQVVKSLAAHSPPKIIDILDETRPGRPLPNLPPELWIMIIRYACLPGPDEVGIAVSSSTTATGGGGAGGSSTVLGMGTGTSHGRETATFLDAPSYYVPASHPHYQHSTTATPSSHHHHHSSYSHQTHSAHHHASLNLTRTSSTNSSTTPPNSASLLADHPLYTSPHRQTPAYKLYLRLMDQKRSFALVSKMWNAYAQPALYEWVWLSNKRQAKALALTLLCQGYIFLSFSFL